jgi:two-component system, NarL family, nitrate/nitrite response regulator NarL
LCRYSKGEVKRIMNELAVKQILVCDTQPVAIEGVRGLLGRCEDLRFAGAVSSLEAAFELTRGLNPAAIVIDKSFGTPAITDWLHRFAVSGETRPGEIMRPAPVIWGSGINESEALRFLQAGARGVLRRTSEPETLLICLRSVTSGNTWLEDGIFADNERLPHQRRSQLTPREIEVAGLVEQGLRNRDIAHNLGIRTGTVKIHLKHIFEKTGVRGRYGLALNGLREKGAIALAPVC